MGRPEAIELTNADEQAKTLVELRLYHMAGRMGCVLTEIKYPLAHLPSELDRMPMPPIERCRQRIRLEALTKPINGGWMERERGPLVSRLH